METFIPKGNLEGIIIPEFILEETRLSLGARLLYALLCNVAASGKVSWPSHQELATHMGCSISSVKNYLNQLEKYGFIPATDLRKMSTGTLFSLNA